MSILHINLLLNNFKWNSNCFKRKLPRLFPYNPKNAFYENKIWLIWVLLKLFNNSSQKLRYLKNNQNLFVYLEYLSNNEKLIKLSYYISIYIYIIEHIVLKIRYFIEDLYRKCIHQGPFQLSSIVWSCLIKF